MNKAKNLVDQAKALNPIPEDKLPNAATVRKLGKTAFTRTDDTNTIRNTASKGAEAAEEQARRQAAETLSKLGSDALIATTFASTVRDRLESGISDADNAKLALDVYLREFSGDPGLATDTLADLKKGTSTTLQYRVTLLEERVAKVREVFEKEVVPVWRDIATIKAENNADIFTLLDYQKRIEKKLAGFSKLGQEVIGTMF